MEEPMLTTDQVDHFRTFGFVVLRGHLAGRAAALRTEVDAAIRDAYAATYHERVIDGISGHYLPMASRLTPVSASLVCDDPRFADAAEQLLDGPVIPLCPEGVLYFLEAAWHTDDGIGVRGVKFAAYFDELAAGTGALRLVPGSHHPEQNERLTGYGKRHSDAAFAVYQASFPGYVAETAPGDGLCCEFRDGRPGAVRMITIWQACGVSPLMGNEAPVGRRGPAKTSRAREPRCRLSLPCCLPVPGTRSPPVPGRAGWCRSSSRICAACGWMRWRARGRPW
jgi:hypothetical protein